MAFFEDRLSPRFTFGARGGPQWNTQVTKVDSGFRSANKKWLMPLHRYDLSECIRSNDDFEEVRAFFYNVSGQFDGFRVKDWGDFQITFANRAQRSSLASVSGSWQLQRSYTKGIRTFNRPIYKPVSGSVVIYDSGGTPLTATVDYTTGLASVSGTPVTWSGEFDVPVAFTSDVMEVEITSKNQQAGLLMSWPSVQVEEIRENLT